MGKSTPLFVGLDVHKDSIAVAHAEGGRADLDSLIRRVFQEGLRAVNKQVDRLQRIEADLRDLAPHWRLAPVVEALHALRGVQWVVAITVVAELGDLTRFDNPRQLATYVGLIPSEYSSGRTRRQGGITKAGNGQARRALIEAAWAYRHPAKVSEHIQRRIDTLPQPLQDLSWKAQVRLCKRFRRLTARGKHPNVAVTAIARELIAFMWAIAPEVHAGRQWRARARLLGAVSLPRRDQ